MNLRFKLRLPDHTYKIASRPNITVLLHLQKIFSAAGVLARNIIFKIHHDHAIMPQQTSLLSIILSNWHELKLITIMSMLVNYYLFSFQLLKRYAGTYNSYHTVLKVLQFFWFGINFPFFYFQVRQQRTSCLISQKKVSIKHFPHQPISNKMCLSTTRSLWLVSKFKEIKNYPTWPYSTSQQPNNQDCIITNVIILTNN